MGSLGLTCDQVKINFLVGQCKICKIVRLSISKILPSLQSRQYYLNALDLYIVLLFKNKIPLE
jgi:hypothetical protein